MEKLESCKGESFKVFVLIRIYENHWSEKLNKKLVSLSDDKLLDLGSVIPLLEY